MNQRTTAEWQAADAAHFLHPFTDFKGLARKPDHGHLVASPVQCAGVEKAAGGGAGQHGSRHPGQDEIGRAHV